MSKKSNNSSKPKTKRSSRRVDRPFAPAILKQARQIAGRYRIVLEPSEELGFIGRALELPTGFAHGATPDECVEATRKGVTAAVATMLEAGRRPPAPASRRGGPRTGWDIRDGKRGTSRNRSSSQT